MDNDIQLDVDLKFSFSGFNKDIKQSFSSAVTGVYGKSGCGKTSFLNAIAGIKPVAGDISFQGQRWQGDGSVLPVNQRGVGYVMQESLLFPHMTVLENICFGLHKDSKFTLDEVLDFLGIVEFADSSVQVLSGGQKQRVALARALIAARKLLLLDEPLSALDKKSRDHILRRLRKALIEKKLPALYVSHSLSELSVIADDLCLYDQIPPLCAPIKSMLTDAGVNLSQKNFSEAIIDAHLHRYCNEDEISYFNCGVGLFQVPGETELEVGTSTRLRIHAKDVSICLHEPVDSSILNVFPALISSIQAFESGKAMVYLKIANELLLASISQKSLRQLQLSPGKEVYIQVKAVAVS